jgi:hypothetical protein
MGTGIEFRNINERGALGWICEQLEVVSRSVTLWDCGGHGDFPMQPGSVLRRGAVPESGSPSVE